MLCMTGVYHYTDSKKKLRIKLTMYRSISDKTFSEKKPPKQQGHKIELPIG